MVRRAVFFAVFALGALLWAPLSAQQGTIVSPILTIDSERLFLNSDFGKRVAREIARFGRTSGPRTGGISGRRRAGA